ncbi:MAG TPA: ABC transporter ATP-binding protein [Streptosporangiaceae bacterium]|nr:ABC transporter ATP-binding protein [Streptosporangiaceae bacterium]
MTMVAGGVPPAVEVSRLCRTFRSGSEEITALRDVSFRIDQGQVVGLLGENGAGKTTLTKILATLLLPTSGTVRLFGKDITRQVREARSEIGVVFGGDRGLYGRLSGRDNVRFFAVLAGVDRRRVRSRVEAVLEEVGLQDVAGRRVETYSRGMRQRLHIAIGVVAEPRLLLLDEPTVGLDPVEAERLRAAIARLRSGGVCVLLTSHYLLDIERLADQVMVLSKGELIANLPVAEFVGLAGFAATVQLRGTGQAPAGDAFASADVEVDSIQAKDESWIVKLKVRRWDGRSFALLAGALKGSTVTDVDVAPVRLEDVYTDLSAQLAATAASQDSATMDGATLDSARG